MRILAISDMHNNVTCVRKLRAQESNDYDVIAIPGDIGSHRAAEIFETLKTFECPIVCIRGNWDHMPEDARFGQQVHFAHLKIVKVGKLAFTGYSFSGSLPNSLGTTANDADYGRKCRALLAAAIRDAGVDLRRCVLMAHDRAAHLDREFPNLLLHLYGHVHTFEVRKRAGTPTSMHRRWTGFCPLRADATGESQDTSTRATMRSSKSREVERCRSNAGCCDATTKTGL
jgi:predicted phosphodiesterase